MIERLVERMYGTPNAAHAPPPDPEFFWRFTPGATRVIGIDPLVSFTVGAIYDTHVLGRLELDGRAVHGMLVLDLSVIAIRDSETDEPLVTLTLRETASNSHCATQVTAHPALKQAMRQ